MDFKRMISKAKGAVEAAGGPDALKEKAEELKGVATGSGSLADKAKAAAQVVKSDPAEAEGTVEAAPAAEAKPVASAEAKPAASADA